MGDRAQCFRNFCKHRPWMIQMARMDKVSVKVARFGNVGFGSSGEEHDFCLRFDLGHVVCFAKQAVFFFENLIRQPIQLIVFGHGVDSDVVVKLAEVRSVVVEYAFSGMDLGRAHFKYRLYHIIRLIAIS